jgi:hypothetical protein
MNRRELLASAMVAVGVPLRTPERSSRRPWHDRSVELEPIEGVYSDFIAWQEWFAIQGVEVQFEGIIEEIEMYSLMCSLADGSAK